MTTTPRLVDREAPLSQAAALLQGASQGSGGVLVFTGGPGSGRTSLLGAVAGLAARQGVAVLRARCAADETHRAYAAARQLFWTTPDGGSSRHPWESDPADVESELWRQLSGHAAEGPLLLVVDDVQSADDASRRWLLQLARRADRLPLLLMVSEYRPYGSVAPAGRFGWTLSPALGRTVRLAPLTPAAVEQLLGEQLAPLSPPRALVDVCLQATGGVPALLAALVTDLAGAGADAIEPTADWTTLPAEAYVESVDHWLHGMGEEFVGAARVLAELDGAPAGPTGADPVGLLGTLCGLQPEHAAGWLRELAGLGVLRPSAPQTWPGFAHPLLRRAVRAVRSPLGAAEVHRAAADALHRRGAPDDAVAGHLVAAGGQAGPGWAAETLLSAARTAQRERRPEQAVAFLRRALAEPLPAGRRGAALTELGGLELMLGPAERAAGVRHLAESVRLHQCDTGVFKAANALGAALAARGQTRTALEVMDELADRFVDRPELAAAVQGAAALIASHDGRSWLEVVDGLRRLVARSTGRRPAPVVRALFAEFDSTSGRLSAAEAAAVAREVAAEPVDRFSRTYVLASAATLAQWADELALADRLVDEGTTGHDGPLVDPGYQSLLSVHAESLVMRARYRELLEGVGPSGRPLPIGPGNVHLVAMAVIALTEQGRLDEARRLARSVDAPETAGTPGPDDSHDSWEWSELFYARGLLRLAAGDPQSALDDLLTCGRRQSERQVVSPIVTPWRSAAADCHLMLGRAGAGADLAAEELEAARRWGTPRTVGRALRAFGAATGGRAGLEATGEAVDLLRTADITPELVPALITHGRMLTEAGRRSAARQVLREAAGYAETIGAARLRGIATGLLADAGARLGSAPRTGTHALTGSERRICGLAAQGHTNPEIAGMLHVAVRTVETHLTNSFRKLGVRRRSELFGRLAPEPDAAPPPSALPARAGRSAP
ncbi:AAA family ATPase [Streptomyces sp. LARHCF249]